MLRHFLLLLLFFFYSKIYIFKPPRKQETTTIITNLCKKHQGPCNHNWTPPINDLSSSVCPIHLSVPYFFNIHMTCDSRIADVVVAAVSVVVDWRCCLMNCNEIRYENYPSLVNFFNFIVRCLLLPLNLLNLRSLLTYTLRKICILKSI